MVTEMNNAFRHFCNDIDNSFVKGIMYFIKSNNILQYFKDTDQTIIFDNEPIIDNFKLESFYYSDNTEKFIVNIKKINDKTKVYQNFSVAYELNEFPLNIQRKILSKVREKCGEKLTEIFG